MKRQTAGRLLSMTATFWGCIAAVYLGLVSGLAAQQAAKVEFLANEVAVYGDTVDHFEAMNVRIANPEGDLVLSVQSRGEPVVWIPSAGDPDGLYRYEVVVITLDPDAAGEPENDDTDRRLDRQSGVFEIRNGAIVLPEERRSGLWDDAINIAGAVLEAIGEAVIPSARAQDVTVDSPVPTIFFDDTNLGVPGEDEWSFSVLEPAGSPATSHFLLVDLINQTTVIEIEESGNSDNALEVDVNGDIGLADDSLFIDRSSGRVGIGTTQPQTTLQLNGAIPQLRFLDEDTNDSIQLGFDNGRFSISGNNGQTVFIRNDAPQHSLNIASDGNVGLGQSFAEASLHVTRDDGTTQVLVEETSTSVGNRTLVQLTNTGRPQIRLSNADSGVNWVTGMGTDDSYIIRRGSNEYRFTNGGRVRWFLAGDPVPRFDYNNNGNLTLAGTLTENSDVNAKRDIVPVDGAAVLTRVAALPVSTWSYRHDESGARHLGPMAQDFHAAFGLGEDDTRVSPRDVAGVALAAVQELMRQKDAQIAALQAQQAALLERLRALEAGLAR